MKRLKLKNSKINKKQDTTKEEENNCKSIQQLIFQDVKNINKFNILLEEFILVLQNFDKKKLKNISDILLELYEYFMIKNEKLISLDLKQFLEDKLEIIFKVYLEVLTNIDDDTETPLISTIFKDFHKFLKFVNKEKIEHNLSQIVEVILLSEDLVESEIIKEFCLVFYGKNKEYFSTIFSSLLEQIKSIKLSTETLYNVYNFIIALGKLSDSKLKFLYQNVMICIINSTNLPKEILVNLLTNLNKVILENLENPLIFSDYLINIYEKSTISEFDVKVLSLSGLFILLTKYKLDYSNYYNMLYKTISQKFYDSCGIKTVFDSKNRNRLYKILELSLKSSTVPIIVILSFIKKLAKICLTTTSNNIAIILGIIKNIIKHHPRAVILLLSSSDSKKKTFKLKRNLDAVIKENSKFNWNILNLKFEENNEEKQVVNTTDIRKADEEQFDEDFSFYAKFDQFDDEEVDAYKTKANLSCLWELYTLKNHFSQKIRQLVYKFESNFLISKDFDLNSISGIKEQDLLYDLGENSHFYLSSKYENINYDLVI